MKLHHDYEGRSRVDLKSSGAARYAIDPSTEIFMCAASREDSDEVRLWINPKFATPDMLGDNEEVEAMCAEADHLAAHNAPFEQVITWGALQNGKPCPFRQEPAIEKYRCTAAMARKAGLPWSLAELGNALNLTTKKDKEGEALIKFFCIPNKEGKFNEPKDHIEKWLKFCEYCKTDVRVEKLADKKLKAFELQGFSLETFLFDLRMNQRGIPLNVPAARNAQKILDQVQEAISVEFRKRTNLNPTQREAVRQYLIAKGVLNLADMTADTVEANLTYQRGLVGHGHAPAQEIVELLEMYQKLSYAAVKKIQVFLDWACPDNRMRGVHLYHGAHTGRWTARGPQTQNAKKPPEWMQGMTELIYGQISRSANPEPLSVLYGEPIELIAGSIRHFIHQPGRPMLNADYNAIEGRIGCWRAGQLDILEDWRTGKDLYRRAAAFVYEVSESSIDKKSPKRAFGKVIELACQFGLGVGGFLRTCENWGIPCDEELAKRAVYEYYRPTHPKIVSRWYMLDDWARQAIKYPGQPAGPFMVRRIAGILYLLLQLPSGRSIAYPHIEINRREPTVEERKEMLAGKKYPEKRFLEITYWGQIPGRTLWGRVKLHGSIFFENEVQGIAADFMAHGGIEAEKRGMPPFMLVHDEANAFATNGQTPADFEAALATLPGWAKGMPLKVESSEIPFYTK